MDDLVRLITRHGHSIDCVIHRNAELPPSFGLADCVAAAGGDGTVARAARALAGGRIPLAIIPLGTANNIATSLNISGPPDEAIGRWGAGRVVPVDVGALSDGRGEKLFIEGVGCGLIPAGVRAAQAHISKDRLDAAGRLARARQIFLDVLEGLQPRRYAMRIDGTQIDGAYLLVEILNIASIGPGISLSSEANPADGLLLVAAAGERDRDALAERVRGASGGGQVRLASWRATTVELSGSHELHVDDEIHGVDGVVTAGVRPGALNVLA